MDDQRWHDVSHLLVRLGLGIVLVDFGVAKLVNPDSWVVFLPLWVARLAAVIGTQPADVLRFQGIVEAMLGLQLALGLLTRLAGSATTALLAAIVVSVAWSPTGVRDLGLLCACAAIVVLGPGRFSVDRYLADHPVPSLPVGSVVAAWAGAVTMAFAALVVFAPEPSDAEAVPLAALAAITDVPIPPLPLQVRVDPERVSLGRMLFNDARLSRDGTISCASCHSNRFAGADGRTVSLGLGGRLARRNAPTVYNAAFNFRQLWDGRAATLEEQVNHPLASADEMALPWGELLTRVGDDPRYVRMFERAFPDGLNAANVRSAIAEFERSLITPNAPFDRWVRGDPGAELPAQAMRGYDLFLSLGCVSCHHGVNVGGGMYQTVGRLRRFYEPDDESDLGRFEITEDPRDRHRFKVPSLRNVALTAPYFHDGSVATLDEAVRVMARYQLGYDLEAEEVAALVAFLHALTGELPEI